MASILSTRGRTANYTI